MRKIILILCTLLISLNLFAQYRGQDAIDAISYDEYTVLKNFLAQTNNPDSLYGISKIPLLHYAVSLDKTEAIKIIIDAGADIEMVYHKETPLMIAVLFSRKQAVYTLLEKGANINGHNDEYETAFMLAAKENNVEMMKLLYDNGADITLKDERELTAIDYAYKMQNIDAYNFLKNKTEDKYTNINLPDYFDGPYVFMQNKNRVFIDFFYNDSLKNKTYHTPDEKILGKEALIIESSRLPFTIKINKNSKKENIRYKNIEKIMAIGDLHGGFDELCTFLINNKITDEDLNWTWGKGHLVFAGDVFDRGNKVTECFWLIYKLEQEAALAGGKVHLILGNHEIMELSGDKRYLADKYIHLCNRLNYNYSELYSDKTILGKWIRTKNIVLIINNILFVHGGISPKLIQQKISMQNINQTVKNILNRPNMEAKNPTEELIMGASGPLWYRGYVKLPDSYYRSTGQKFDFTEEKLNTILKFYKVNTIVFANTHVSKIQAMYHGKLYGIDIEFSKPDIDLEALLWQKNHFYRVLINGSKQQLD
ncbi:MAG: metallophosphoesterase [Bacteroidales bacterium]|nr:metallophosphoesterase [Bacteroidales bacterium]